MRGVARETVEPATPWLHRVTNLIAWGAVAGIAAHLVLRFLAGAEPAVARVPLLLVLAGGGTPLVVHLAAELWRRNFGSDLLAGISIVTSVLLGEYLAGALVVLMLSGGEALERYAVGRASSVLRALARRMPSAAHRRTDGRMVDVGLEDVDVDDVLVVLPHEICPVDGEVIEGHGVMDESYLTGEPYEMSKAPGSQVLSGSINGESALTIRATHRAVDSRYAKIMEVMRESEQRRPRIRRLADRLGAYYTRCASSRCSWSRPRARCSSRSRSRSSAPSRSRRSGASSSAIRPSSRRSTGAGRSSSTRRARSRTGSRA